MPKQLIRVGLDLDEVMYPLHNVMTDMVGLPNSMSKWEFYEEWGWTKKDFIDFYHDSILNHELFIRKPIVDMNLRVINLLKQMGYHIVICTIRGEHAPQHIQKVAREQTKYWLESNKVPYDELIFSDNKNDANSVCFFDDNIQNYEAMERESRTIPFIFTQPYNRSFRGRRVNHFREIPGSVIWSTRNRRDEDDLGRKRRRSKLLVQV